MMFGLAGAALARPAWPASAATPALSAPGTAARSCICGAALPLSGSKALAGDEIARGIRLAIDAVQAQGGAGGLAVTLLRADMPDQGSATAAVNGLINDGHAQLVLGSGATDLCYPASAAAELAQIPYIELNAPADGICARGFKYLLRTGPATAMAAALATQTMQTRLAGRRLGLLYDTGATGGAFAAALRAALAAAKIPVEICIPYPPDVEDLHDQAGRLMRAKVDVLIHEAGPDGALGLALAGRTQGWQPGALLGYGAGYAYRESAAALAGGLDGTYVIAAPFYPPAAAAVRAAYEARFGVPPRAADSLSAYVGARLVLETIGQAEMGGAGWDAGKLLGALRRLDIAPGGLINGFGVAFDHNGQNTRACVSLQQWRGGALVPV